MATPPLGWVPPKDRTAEQENAHYDAMGKMTRFAAPFTRLAKGEKIILARLWADPRVTQDVGGFTFNRFHQLTGSCVGASFGTALFSLIATQRCIATDPTKAFVPFWPFNYGRGRLLAGFRGQGEGSIDSVEAQQVQKEGVIDAATPNLPKFVDQDGLVISSKNEMLWSDGKTGAPLVEAAKVHPLGTAAAVNDSDGVYGGIVNGYPYVFGCDNYVPNGHIAGSGADAYVTGGFGSRGGHSTGIGGVWEHPNDGTLFLYQNNWPRSVYPSDPNNLTPPCSLWLTEKELNRTWAQLSGKNEGFLLSHLTWFPAQQELLNYVY